MAVASSCRLREPREIVAKASLRAAKVGEERMTFCVVTWYGWEFSGCGRATATLSSQRVTLGFLKGDIGRLEE
jgi:hypothetical protein